MQTHSTAVSVMFGLDDIAKVVKMNISHSTSTVMKGVDTESGGCDISTSRVCEMSVAICTARACNDAWTGLAGCSSRIIARALVACERRLTGGRPAATASSCQIEFDQRLQVSAQRLADRQRGRPVILEHLVELGEAHGQPADGGTGMLEGGPGGGEHQRQDQACQGGHQGGRQPDDLLRIARQMVLGHPGPHQRADDGAGHDQGKGDDGCGEGAQKGPREADRRISTLIDCRPSNEWPFAPPQPLGEVPAGLSGCRKAHRLGSPGRPMTPLHSV